MYGPTRGEAIFYLCFIAFVGWAVIEGVLWVFRHLTWN